jgi:hypothetical protein
MKNNDFDAVLRRYAGLQADVSRQRGVIAEMEEEGHRTGTARKLLDALEDDLSHLQQSVWGFTLDRQAPVPTKRSQPR